MTVWYFEDMPQLGIYLYYINSQGPKIQFTHKEKNRQFDFLGIGMIDEIIVFDLFAFFQIFADDGLMKCLKALYEFI